MVVGLASLYVAYGGLWWMQALFYGVGAAVVGIIAISAYKLVVATVPHVVVLGETPGTGINDELTRLLGDGAATQLPPGLIAQLAERRSQQEGPWAERHPGLPGEPLA